MDELKTLAERLREAFKRKRYGAGSYDPDFDLFDVAADTLDSLESYLLAVKAMEQREESSHRIIKKIDAALSILN